MIPIANPLIGDEEREAVDAVLRSGMLAQGPEVEAFEHEFATAAVAGRHCVAVNSGTSALHLGMLAAGIGPGDEVVVPSFTFAATANAVRLCGADPVFVDIDPVSFCMDPAAAAAAVTDRTAAIMPVHLYGHPAAMGPLQEVADRHGLLLFEDAAQAHLATWHGQQVGTFGRVAIFSFYPTKNMTTGEGGMIVTDDDEVARRARLLRNQGMARQYHNELVGFNARMTDLHASIGRVQLRKLVGWTETRQKHAALLDESLRGVVIPAVAAGVTHVYHQYTVRTDDRDALIGRLETASVGYGIYYPVPVHELPSFGMDLDLPETRRAAAEVVSLPVGPHLDASDLEHVAQAVNG